MSTHCSALTSRRPVALVLAALAAPFALTLSPALAATNANGTTASHRLVDVVVSGTSGALAQVESAVRTAGGTIRTELPLIDGVAARVPSSAVAGLRTATGVRAVTGDAKGKLQGVDPTLGYDVSNDQGSIYKVAQVTHAKDAWSHGYTGAGIGVALIDSGVAPVKGLTSGNVINGPDLSFESQDPNTAHLDTFGHGTHMASIIAGRDVASNGAYYAKADSHQYFGVAPDANLISIKVADNDGAADVSQIIAAIGWVTQHANDPGLNIRVLNLSYGTDSVQDPSIDPLCYAVEQAWRAGIVVVVSSGNDGTNRQTLSDPAQDPLVIAVGADDTRGTDSVGDDVVPAFAQRGTNARHVDLITPGLHMLGLRDPNSRIDQENPGARVNGRFFRGTGTSQSAAVTSGLVALYLSRYPTATPDQVKRVLMLNATQPNSVKTLFAGVGVPDINKSLGMKPPVYSQPDTGATGTGSLEASRGSAHITSGSVVLQGEQDIFGQAWDPTAVFGTGWSGGDWNGHTWTGASWDSSGWTGHTWTGHTWTDNDWAGHTWTGHTWTGHTWTDNGWNGQAWTDDNWAADTWTASTWASSTWE